MLIHVSNRGPDVGSIATNGLFYDQRLTKPAPNERRG